jgi:hypothetical protein
MFECTFEAVQELCTYDRVFGLGKEKKEGRNECNSLILTNVSSVFLSKYPALSHSLSGVERSFSLFFF